MDTLLARERLIRMIGAEADPALTAGEIDDLLELCRMPDRFGRQISNTNWIPSYDLYRGAAEGCRWKAARCADRYNFLADGTTFNRAQTHTHWLKLADEYDRRSASLPRVLRARGSTAVDRYSVFTVLDVMAN